MTTAELEQLVNRLARVLRHRLPGYTSVAVEDLRQAGWIGALEARARWRDTGVACFETYADKRILGAMLDELRRWYPGCAKRRARPRQLPQLTSFEDMSGLCDPCSYDPCPQLPADRLTPEEELVLLLYATHDDPAEPRAARAVERAMGKRIWPVLQRARRKLEALAA